MSWNWYRIDDWSYLICISINLLIQSMTLVKLICSGKYNEGVKITLLFMLSNIAIVFYYVSGFNLYAERNILVNVCVNGITTLVYCALQNTAHWMFSYEYYNMVRLIPYILDDITPPESMVKCNRVQYWFWLLVNIIFAIGYGASIFIVDFSFYVS